MNKAEFSPEDYPKLPYTRILIPDEETGTYSAEIAEFPGCFAQGETPEEAYKELEEVAKSWIEAALDLGQEIPRPMARYDYSGRFALRLPKSLHREASLAAEREGVSLNQFIVSAISERLGALNLYEKLAEKILQEVQRQHFVFQKAFNKEIERFEKYTIEQYADTSRNGIAIRLVGSNILIGGSVNAGTEEHRLYA